MKRFIYGAVSCLLVSTSLLSSCTKGFNEINVDPINYIDAAPEKLLAPALTTSLTAGMMRNRNFNNELMQVTVSISDGDATVFRYEYRATFADYLWNNWYLQLTNFKDVYNKAKEPKYLNTSYQGISLVCQSWLYSNLTDVYGDIPYSESNQGNNRILEPKFDTQKSIYEDLFKKLEEANTLLTAGTPITASSDPVFNGDVAKWRKFCNSLYLRLLLRVSGKSEVAPTVIAKIKEIVDTNPAKYPIMTSNSETASLRWTGEIGTGVYVSPYVNGVRTQDFRQPSMAQFFIERIAGWNDPRVSTLAADGYAVSGINRWGIAQGATGGFKGVPSGYAAGTGVVRESYFYSYDQTSSSVALGARSLQQNPLTGILMNSAEVQFILAEAAVKGYISGSPETYYYKGMAQAINYWVPPFSEDPNNTKFRDYTVAADIDWDNSGNLEAKMEQIHQQKYYALFMIDLQQWFEYRRTGHPYLPKGPGMANGGVMPARMTYPVVVQSSNPTNYKNAVAVQGPDVISTNVWWQKP
jgi:hypothetical protein